MTDIRSIADMYDSGADYEDVRLRKNPVHELEYLLTVELLDEYIGKESAVLDIGAGTGVYSEYLVKNKKCTVGLIDISKRELDIFRSRCASILDYVEFTHVRSATDIGDIENGKYDAVLLFGPLYHLTDKRERREALNGAYNKLKSDGILFTAHISPHRVYKDLLGAGTQRINDPQFLDDLAKGITYHTCMGKTAVQYRAWPGETKKEIAESGFEVIRLRAVEGVFSYVPEEQFTSLHDAAIKKKWIDIARSTSENEDIIGATLHYVTVCRKKG